MANNKTFSDGHTAQDHTDKRFTSDAGIQVSTAIVDSGAAGDGGRL